MRDFVRDTSTLLLVDLSGRDLVFVVEEADVAVVGLLDSLIGVGVESSEIGVGISSSELAGSLLEELLGVGRDGARVSVTADVCADELSCSTGSGFEEADAAGKTLRPVTVWPSMTDVTLTVCPASGLMDVSNSTKLQADEQAHSGSSAAGSGSASDPDVPDELDELDELPEPGAAASSSAASRLLCLFKRCCRTDGKLGGRGRSRILFKPGAVTLSKSSRL